MKAAVRTVAIAGAGIGGLTLAIALRKLGIEAHVYERAAALHPVGAGLSLMPNAMLALRALGLDEAVAARGAIAQDTCGRLADGRVLQRFPIADVAREVGAPAVLLHRAELHAVLLDALGREHVTLGRTVTGYRDDGTAVAIASASAPSGASACTGSPSPPRPSGSATRAIRATGSSRASGGGTTRFARSSRAPRRSASCARTSAIDR